ncbi:hypothetical protein SNOG_00977 [Parastagonospora nodorum SN15]|uniref:Uncharacterized protein n=1 Tax=Phaeosphaeria nodorum (strain SN15 / ATCC MYA-4574 / FGSC 10173) TaxID=321614 RepID=Q0V4T7_PHANO|nr:hypothetical protein SNOG_00977 [Parastagonospora nodorum SN15]EAT92472.1 hypothetical protein SNOG_00977 [Parastagonospora nodorum SN15]
MGAFLLLEGPGGFALTRSILCPPRLPGSRCNSESPFQTARTNVLPSALVPGSRVKSTGTPRRSRLSLPYIGVPLGIIGYHSNDTASSPPPRQPVPTKARRALGPAARGRIAAEKTHRAAESVVESTIQLPSSASRHAADRHPVHREWSAHTGGGKGEHHRTQRHLF